MLSARPEVKRTYSRLPKREDESPQENPVELATPSDALNSENDKSAAIIENFNNGDEKLSSLQPEKMRKITDFFRVKRKSLNNQSETPEKQIKTQNVQNHPDETQFPSSPVSSVSNKLKQTFLDLGQKNLISSQCSECLMHYNKSFPDDVALHRKFHSNYLKGYNFNLGQSGNCEEIGPAGEAVLKWSKYRFYALKAFDAAAFKKLEFFLNFVHVQLGAEPLACSELCDAGRFDAIFAVDFGSSRIVGFGLFEPCSMIYKSLMGCDDSAIELEGEPFHGNHQRATHGVSRVWTDSNHRSKGLASLVLDLKCGGMKDSLAFSQPTPAGFAFAKAYQRSHFFGKQCLIYLK